MSSVDSKLEAEVKVPVKRSTSFRDDAIRRFKKNPTAIFGLVIVIFFLLIAIFGKFITPHDPFKQNIINAHQSPGGQYLLGTDFFGRDVLSRIFIGARISLLVGVAVVTLRAVIGIPYGLVAGYYGGRIEAFMMRIVDAFIAFPGIILAMAIMAVRGPGIENVIFALTISGWPMFARLVRGESMSLKEREYVQAARALGYNDGKVMFQHILPNCLATIIVYTTMGIATPILAEAGLSFLGLGATADQATWGFQMSLERQYMRTAWWSVTFPGLALMVVILGFNLLGDGLRDVLDPRMKE
ncbi:binding-protein-dependent transport systems inner membrane component [Alkaliphilus metalliredigens QYMF]|uniref:Binding-protein-dependent transport systems inner membrane component n=1 Tax=Alkaliphilus metalliredigens (strain QYMF) TaxID=293826 RepID=A6TPV6_ALKMQ|nr:ABC transporter permease [Alkaliphilus metalliredigens]ABR48224.1 binding-protein-dependent transport systems inner membrane component [Alkaliphilus metalliredigens QYMF]